METTVPNQPLEVKSRLESFSPNKSVRMETDKFIRIKEESKHTSQAMLMNSTAQHLEVSAHLLGTDASNETTQLTNKVPFTHCRSIEKQFFKSQTDITIYTGTHSAIIQYENSKDETESRPSASLLHGASVDLND